MRLQAENRTLQQRARLEAVGCATCREVVSFSRAHGARFDLLSRQGLVVAFYLPPHACIGSGYWTALALGAQTLAVVAGAWLYRESGFSVSFLVCLGGGYLGSLWAFGRFLTRPSRRTSRLAPFAEANIVAVLVPRFQVVSSHLFDALWRPHRPAVEEMLRGLDLGDASAVGAASRQIAEWIDTLGSTRLWRRLVAELDSSWKGSTRLAVLLRLAGRWSWWPGLSTAPPSGGDVQIRGRA